MKTRKNPNSTGPFRVAALLAAVCALFIICLALCLVKCNAFDGATSALTGAQPIPIDVAAAASSAPTSAPTPQPLPELTFLPDPASPFAQTMGRVPLGKPQPLSGMVTSNYPLESVSATFLCDYTEDPFYPYVAGVTFAPGSNVTTYSFEQTNTAGGVSLASQIDLGMLQTGVNALVIQAKCQGMELPAEVFSTNFYVLGDTWKRFTAEDFSNNGYRTALAFFGGDPERFLYRYQNVYGRYTVADPEWETRYITPLDMGYDEPWLVHVDAVPYYEKLREYLQTGFVRVHGTNGDTGVLPLSRLIVVYHGSFVSRFTSAKRSAISHHALGTTTDVNAIMEPNMNTKANLALIDNEVRSLLTYNGILTENGVSYYDFTYTGSYRCTDYNVPETIINYLLYELAFYRAGFQWGHYYNSTSDGMHFTLSENIKNRHNGGSRGLQKVTEYYN